jgi:hypothetical protein
MRFCAIKGTLIAAQQRLPSGVVMAAVAASCCLLPLAAKSQSLQAQPLAASHPAVENCFKRFRLAEISAQVPHQRGAMTELCSDIEISCKADPDARSDCARAIARLDRSLASATAAMNGVSRTGK